jgi:hypothetical protein
MNAKETIEGYFPEMRWRCLSLAADLDRLDRVGGAAEGEPRMRQLREALAVLLSGERDRARRVQMIFSDRTPRPMA